MTERGAATGCGIAAAPRHGAGAVSTRGEAGHRAADGARTRESPSQQQHGEASAGRQTNHGPAEAPQVWFDLGIG